MTPAVAGTTPSPDPWHTLDPLDLSRRHTVVVAVSGGSDSLALLHIANSWLRARAPHVTPVAVTIDHALRPASADEAEQVARHCRELGIVHRTKVWRHRSPAGGVAAKAREARYRLLGEAADEAGTDIVLLGHTLDDQAETISMRQARSSAGGFERGSAGMAPATFHGWRKWLVRPLLGSPRSALRAFLRSRGIDWIDDPSNEDRRYERVRTRRALENAGCETIEALVADAKEAARLRRALGRRAAAIIGSKASRPSPGLYHLSNGFAADEYADAALYAFRAMLASIGGKEQLPDATRARRLLADLGRAGASATLSRVAVEARRDELWLRRELRGLATMPASSGAIWDGRHRIERVPAPGATIGPTGLSEAQMGMPDGSRLQRAALAAERAFRLGDEVLDSETASACTVPVVAPFARFLPGFDLELATALAELLGAPKPPPSPWRQHNEDIG